MSIMGEKNDAKHFEKQNTHKHGHSIFWKQVFTLCKQTFKYT
jgi:hypothetical protein